MDKHITKSIVVLLAAISAITPFAIDGYLPAIPVIAGVLHSKTSMVSIHRVWLMVN
ncbi:hypothetical protein [Psychromonas sp.]|uniref:hypothetical protein n=1 Tax=Psychromonas sp. TaxID=1884585 RepID=UPI003568364D